MKNSDMPAMPTYEINTDCGLDGNSGPDLVQTINSGLTKREHFAGLAMQGLIAADTDDVRGVLEIALIAVNQADTLLAELAKELK